jgi:hypothetical protein
MLVYFAMLAKQACPGHACDGLGHLGPAELCSDEPSCCPHPWVVDRVQQLETASLDWMGTSWQNILVEMSLM